VATTAVANLGFKLFGALRQIDTLAGASAGIASSMPSEARHSTRVEPASSVLPAPSAAAAEQTAATLPSPVSEGEPQVPFDTEAALREAGDRDPDVAEFLNDPDPAVGGAVRDFITSLAPPGGR